MSKDFLIIDDDFDFSDLMKRGLTRLGYDVDNANSKQEVMRLIDQESYSDILLDLNLKTLSGLELLPVLLDKQNASKITILTGYASISTAVEAIKKGASNYLTKPITVNELIEKLDHFCEEKLNPSTSLYLKESELIQSTLESCQFNVSKTAKQLGISRRTLQRKLKKNHL